ncbi:unnamed protein product, partial [marine sediment metagenome]
NLAIFGPLIAALILIARKREERGIRRFLARAWDWSFSKKWLTILILAWKPSRIVL